MQSTARLATIRALYAARVNPFSGPAAFHPVPAARHAPHVCGGVKFRSAPPAPADELFDGLAPNVPDYVPDWRPVSSLPVPIQRWIGNGFAVGAPIRLP